MKVLKFGGTSVGSAERIKNVREIITDGHQKIVVLSAMSGTTNSLVDIAELIKAKDIKGAKALINELQDKYNGVVNALVTNQNYNQSLRNTVSVIFQELIACLNKPFNNLLYNTIVCKGELLSTQIFAMYLTELGHNVQLINALDFMRVDKLHEPDEYYIEQNLRRLIAENPTAEFYITQGFICRDAKGEITNLKRGGSDYTATIIGAAIKSSEVQIWTDIDGFHNNDPRYVSGTRPLSLLSFDEAAELAYFGAKILHPQTVMPASEFNIPVRLKNTMDPSSAGTLITKETQGEGIKAIAAKDGITAIKIKSARMLQAHGFLKRVFEVFEKYETPIDMITTSEIAVSLTIDNDTYISEIVEELEKFSKVTVDTYRTIVCLVGNRIIFHNDTPNLFQVLKDIDVRMISYGGSNNNISLLINTGDKIETLNKLHSYLFEDTYVNL